MQSTGLFSGWTTHLWIWPTVLLAVAAQAAVPPHPAPMEVTPTLPLPTAELSIAVRYTNLQWSGRSVTVCLLAAPAQQFWELWQEAAQARSSDGLSRPQETLQSRSSPPAHVRLTPLDQTALSSGCLSMFFLCTNIWRPETGVDVTCASFAAYCERQKCGFVSQGVLFFISFRLKHM